MNLSLQARLALSVFSIPFIIASNECAWGSNPESNGAARRLTNLTPHVEPQPNPIVQNNHNLAQPNEPIVTAEGTDQVLRNLGINVLMSRTLTAPQRETAEHLVAELRKRIIGCSIDKVNKLNHSFCAPGLSLDVHLCRLNELLKLFKDKPDSDIEKSLKWLPEFYDMRLISAPNQYIMSFLALIDRLSEKQLFALKIRVNLLGAMNAVRRGNINSARFLHQLYYLPTESFKRILHWNQTAKVFNRCYGHAENMEILLDFIMHLPEDKLKHLALIFDHLPENYLEGAETCETKEVLRQDPSGTVTKDRICAYHSEMSEIINWIAADQPSHLAQSIMLLDRLKEAGFNLRKYNGRTPPLHLLQLLKHFSTCQIDLSSKRLQSCLSWIRKYQLHKIANRNSFADVLLFLQQLHIDYGVVNANDDIRMEESLAWMERSGTLALCSNLREVAQVLCLNKLSTEHPLKDIEDHIKLLGMWEDNEGFLPRYRKLSFFTQTTPKNSINDLSDCLQMLFEEKEDTARFIGYAIARFYRHDMVGVGGMVKNLKGLKRSFRASLVKWLETSNGFNQCENLEDLMDLIQLYSQHRETSLDLLDNFVKLISQSDFSYRNDGRNTCIATLKDLMKSCTLLRSEGKQSADFMAKVLTKFESSQMTEVFSKTLQRICSLKQEDRTRLISYLESSGVLNMCGSVNHLDGLVEIFQEGQEFNLLPRAIDWLKKSQDPVIIDDGRMLFLNRIMFPLFRRHYDEQAFQFAEKVFYKFAPAQVDSSENIASISEALGVFNFVVELKGKHVHRTAQDRARLINWLEASSMFEMSSKPRYLKTVISIYNEGLTMESLKRSLEWLKEKNVKVLSDFTSIILHAMLCPHGNEHSNTLFGEVLRHLVQRNWLDRDFVEICMLSLRHFNPELEASVRERTGEITSQNERWHLLAHAFCAPNPAVVRYYEDMFEAPPQNMTRRQILNKIVEVIGQNHVFAQTCTYLQLDYDNPNKPRNCLPIHRQMMEMSRQVVIHPEDSQTEGYKLNIDMVKEPRPAQIIHMPLNVWNRFFEMAKAMDKSRLDELCGETPVEKLWAQEDNDMLTSLLDPLDSLRATPGVSGYSQMLRLVLKNIQTTQNIETFIQLLVNVLTCETGKMNGIIHSYSQIINNCVLAEKDLDSEAFKTNLRGLIKEGLLRCREACISLVAMTITRGRGDPAHNNNFVRGVIGREVGLFLESERPAIDINNTYMDNILLATTKQEMLNLFYSFYNVEKVINYVHTMLHDGSIKLDNKISQTLAAKVIIAYLEDESLGDDGEGFNASLVITNEKGTPEGLTAEAVKKVLVQMGILLPTRPQDNPCAEG